MTDQFPGGTVGGRSVVFTVDGTDRAPVATSANGTATLSVAGLPGVHTIAARVAETDRYLATDAGTVTVTVAVTGTSGKVNAAVSVAEGSATVGVNGDGTRLKGSVTWTSRTGNLTMVATMVGDVFRIWVDGAELTTTGRRTAGNLQVHK